MCSPSWLRQFYFFVASRNNTPSHTPYRGMRDLKQEVCCWCGSRVRLQPCVQNPALWECADQLWFRCVVREASFAKHVYETLAR